MERAKVRRRGRDRWKEESEMVTRVMLSVPRRTEMNGRRIDTQRIHCDCSHTGWDIGIREEEGYDIFFLWRASILLHSLHTRGQHLNTCIASISLNYISANVISVQNKILKQIKIYSIFMQTFYTG